MSTLEEILKIDLRRILRVDDAGVQEDKTQSNRKKEIQSKDDGFGRGTEAVQEFTSR